MAVQITASGVGQTFMISAVVLGALASFDAILFMMNEPSVMAKLNIFVMLGDKVRGVIELGLGIMLIMFGLGLWTVQVGGIAIAALIAMTSGTHWAYRDSKGQATQQTTTASTKQQRTTHRYLCPLNQKQKEWCDEDADRDGTINRYDSDFNNKGQAQRNCQFGNYITNTNRSGCTILAQ